MNRNLCVLSASRGAPFLVVARYQDGLLMIARAEEIRAKQAKQDGKQKIIASVDELVNKELSEYHSKGYAVAVDEDMPYYSIPYQRTPLLSGDDPIFVEAFRAYQSLSDRRITFKPGVVQIKCGEVAESEVGDGGKMVYRVNGESFNSARAAILLVAYHALNADITDINYLRSLFDRNERQRRLKASRSRG